MFRILCAKEPRTGRKKQTLYLRGLTPFPSFRVDIPNGRFLPTAAQQTALKWMSPFKERIDLKPALETSYALNLEVEFEN